jgi:ABC-type branched-subunit amino acid transport system substrate-binding protein
MKKEFLISLAVFLAAALIFCGGAMSAPAEKEILVGTALPLSGMFAGFGQGGLFGLEAAVEDINKLGGVYVKELKRKLPIRFIVVDTESDGLKTGTLTEGLILREKVHFLVSSPDVPPLIAAKANIAERYKVPFVSNTGPYEPYQAMRKAAKPPWQYTWATGFHIAMPFPPTDFRNKPGYTIMDTWMAMVSKFGDQTNRRVGVFASDEPDGRGWYATFPPGLKKAGLDVLGVEKELGVAPMGTTDFTPIIRKWKAYDCQMLWGNAPGPFFGTMWRQCRALGFKPKMVFVGRAALYYTEVSAWGGDLPYGVGTELWWHPALKEARGFGDTTPKSLFERWVAKTGRPLNQSMGWGYPIIQILVDAIQRAGTLDRDKVNKAIGETDLITISHRVLFDKNDQFSSYPLAFGQWFKTDKPQKWEQQIVYSPHEFMPATAAPIFPVPYK